MACAIATKKTGALMHTRVHTSGGDVGEVECESGSSRGELDAVAVEGILERVEIRDHNDVADRQRHQLGRVISVACE
jgi:hypothetical protein